MHARDLDWLREHECLSSEGQRCRSDLVFSCVAPKIRFTLQAELRGCTSLPVESHLKGLFK